MNKTHKVKHLVVDTSAFIRNAPLQDIGVNIITVQDVINEVINKRQLKRLAVLPYNLTVQDVDSETIKFVTEFAKKTGDYTSLSATDIKVIALTYQLAMKGGYSLRKTPITAQIIPSKPRKTQDFQPSLTGFHVPTETNVKNQDAVKEDTEQNLSLHSLYYRREYGIILNSIEDRMKSSKNKDDDDDNDEKNEDDDDDDDDGDNDEENEDDDDDGDNDEENEDDDDDSDWITPGNISNVRRELDCKQLEQKDALVACLTMDFAMQNVLKQIGLSVVALDGRLIRQMRTHILRCYACFKTTSIVTKVFCPNCGNKTLKKVGVTLDAQGNQRIHINFRKPISKKGKRFPLPMPKGGKHAVNPILVEDQPVPDQRISKLARAENDPLQEDYIAGYSPFVTRDVYSKSAMLGIRQGGSFKYWMKKNPNESVRRRK